ncbi:MAG: trehalose-6-phosphate synthase [Proteobacteria bacterium]|nr:trehalose-6-phosphate synthase [Pseudomonadota bacterium]MBU1570898.1 trehalose-6-phosphate synthase [Pseudomonadota bacterium]
MADAINFSLSMEANERSERMKRMHASVKKHNIYRWAGELIATLARLRISETPEQEKV